MEISQLPSASTIDASADVLPIVTNSINTTQKINRNTFLNLASQPLGLTDTQSPTNKTFDNSNILTIKDSNLTIQNSSSVTKQAVFSAASITAGQTRTYTLPDLSDTLLTLTASQTLTNKTLTSPTLNNPTISNATITADTYAGFTASTTGTIYGISVTTGAISSALSLTSTLTVTGTSTLNGQLSVQTGTAPPASGLATAGILFSSTASLGLFYGSGAPTFSAAKGSLYVNTSATTTTTRLYINSSGSTTWTTFTAAA